MEQTRETMNKTLHDGLRILDFLAHEGHPQSLTTITQATGLGKSKTHRLLQTLIAANYVFRPSGTSKYQTSIHLWNLGSSILRHDGLRSAAQSTMHTLVDTIDESVHLSLLEDLEVVYLHKVESNQPVRAYSQIGGRMPAHRVATGKAILAFRNDALLKLIHERLANNPDSKVPSIDNFMAEMQAIRASRVAVNRGEWHTDVFGVAAPIMGNNGTVIAAIGVSGPSERFDDERLKKYSDLVRNASTTITENLFGVDLSRWWQPG